MVKIEDLKLEVNSDVLRNALYILSGFSNKALFRVSNNLLKAISIDYNDAIGIEITMRKVAVSVVGKVLFSVNLKDLRNILKETIGSVVLKIDTQKESLSVLQNNEIIGEVIIRRVTLEEWRRYSFEKIVPEIVFEMKRKEFKTVVNAFNKLGLYITNISVEKDYIVIKGKTDVDTCSLVFKMIADIEEEEEEEEHVGKYCFYSTHLLVKATRPSFTDEVELRFGENYPLSVSYRSNKMEVTYYIAPRLVY